MNDTKYLILIDGVTGTVLNYDKDVYVVDANALNEEDTATLEEWYASGHDGTIIGLAEKVGTPITQYVPLS